MLGIEILGAVAASIEVIKVLRSSLLVLNNARDVPKQVRQQRDMHFRLLVQTEVFESWCETIGISKFQYSKELEGTQEYTDLQRILEAHLRLANNSVAESTLGSVVRLRDKFEEASGILQGHGPSRLKNGLPIGSSENDKKLKRKRFGIFSRSQNTKHLHDDQAKTEIKSDNIVYPTAKSLQWVATDRKAFQVLLKDITDINDDLITLLELGQRRRVRRQAEMAILCEIPASSESIKELPVDNGLATMIKMKSLQEENRDGLPASGAAKHFQPRVYRVEEFQGEFVKLGDTRSMSRLDGEAALIEWKFYSKERPLRMERMLQIGSLVRLLNETELFKKFLAPKCRGLVNDDINWRVGIVFAPPTPLDVRVQTPPKYLDLQSFIKETSVVSSAIPPLGVRFEMARKLALAMHHLHCVQWLHKSFRSDNIILFDNTPGKKPFPTDDPSVRNQSHNRIGETNNSTLPSTVLHDLALQLVGWDLSRPDNPAEFSESLSNSLENFQSQRQNIKLYSHPDVCPTPGKRVRYRMQFDIYSLGLVLLEIGHWRTLDMIRKKCTSDEDFRQKLKYEWCDKLLSRMGTVYWRATQRCIFGDFDASLSNEGADTDYSLQKAFQRQVVSELEKCFA